MAQTTASSPSELDAVPGPLEPCWRLHIVASLDPSLRGRVLDLRRGAVVLGRKPGDSAAIVIDDARMSREHALLRVRDGFSPVEVQDLGSRNGLYQAGEKVERASLGQGAVLRLGGTVVVLESDTGRFADHDTPCAELPGRGVAARALRAQVAQAARDDHPTLIVGETGTGKEYAAMALHKASRRRGKLVRFNVAAVADNLFESELFGHVRGAFTGAVASHPGRVREADGGTLVLDEIGELSSSLQAKLLRVLEERLVRPVGGERDLAVDVRFVAVTNADLPAAVAQGRFRPDLLARLQMHQVRIAPVAARRCDLMALCDAVLPLLGAPGAPAPRWSERLHADAVEWLLLRSWGGNLREVKSVLLRLRETAAVQTLSKADIVELLPEAVQPHAFRAAPWRTASDATPLSVDLGPPTSVPTPESLTAPYGVAPKLPPAPPRRTPSQERPDAEVLRALLQHHNGSIEAVAREFERDRRQVYRWLEYAGIGQDELDRYRGGDA